MLSTEDKEKLERGFAEAEASLFLSGMTPTENVLAVKARILSGEITFEQGEAEIMAYHLKPRPAAAVTA